jgi:DNA-binding beta-propeller fold protein YncE
MYHGVLRCALLVLTVLVGAALLPDTADVRSRQAEVPLAAYTNFEGAQTNPIRLNASGTRLFAVNTADARLSVFDLREPTAPRLLAEIPVGLEPVSVNPRSDDEAWVVNQISGSVSIVSVARGIVTDTLRVPGEPADVVFVGNLAFVSVARHNAVRVFDATTHAPVAAIALEGMNPRALAVSPDSRKVYVAFALSGNRTTIVPADSAPPPAPTNPSLPPAPQQGIVVDASDPQWQDVIRYTLPDNDVAEIDVATLTVRRYFAGVGTINLGLAVQPTTGDVYVANTEARNRVRFEPNLRGHLVDNRVTRVTVADGTVTPVDLNPTIDYSELPSRQALDIALAQPTAMVFAPGGDSLYVAAFGTDRIARLDAAANVVARVDVAPSALTGTGADSANKRGPRGLALHPSKPYLYVLNRIANTVAVIDTVAQQLTLVAETPVSGFDPTPTVIRKGRGFLYDAKLSGSGTAACAACHVDADMDFLAWDLGDPGGSVRRMRAGTVHPMKGPMMTQSLRGLEGEEPYHWRGDRVDFMAFNLAFDSLMGGVELTSAEMAAFRDFVNTLRFPPNPNQNLDRTPPAMFAGGDRSAGRDLFLNAQLPMGSVVGTCTGCHTDAPGSGSKTGGIHGADALRLPQAFKAPHFRNLYQKTGFQNQPGARSIVGFGFSHNGAFSSMADLLGHHFLGDLATDPAKLADLNAFLMTFDTGTAPAVGYTRTITPANLADPDVAIDWMLLEAQAAAGNVDLIAKGTVDGVPRGLLYRPQAGHYLADRTGVGPFQRDALAAKIAAGDTLSVMGVPPGSGVRMSLDRDLDGRLDGD